MVIEIYKRNGEYQVNFKYDEWISKLVLFLSENEEFKSFVLEDYVSANKNFFDVSGIEYKTVGDVILVDGKCIETIANDNIVRGKIYLSSERYHYLVSRPSVSILSLPYDYCMTIEDEDVKIEYRDPKYTLKVISFLMLRSVGVIPSYFHIENMVSSLKEIFNSDAKFIRVEIVKFSRYVLPHKVEFSILVIVDDRKNYYSLTLRRNIWKVRSINSENGSVNIIHKIILNSYYWLVGNLEKIDWLNNVIVKVSKIFKIKSMRVFLITVFSLLGIYLVLRYALFLTIFFMIVLFMFLKRLFLYFNFRGRLV
ncbi:MAG: hypothetical protein N2712_03470 [Brevinematales bacterium]|nr:hypothetical protein [Brevinematales bacterium]